MHQLQELVRLYRLNTGVRERARLLGMSTRTEREYRLALAAAGLLAGKPEEPPELSVLRAAVEAAKPAPPPRIVPSSIETWLPAIRKSLDGGAGPQAIWDRLHRTDPEFTASVSAVKRAVRRLRREEGVKATDVVIPVDTKPGEVAQVDFGFAGRFFDPATGLVRKAWVFIMVLGYSRHLFAKLVYDQKATTWVALHVEAFTWFGGVPEVIVPDNLKAAVVRAAFGAGDRHELALNRSYRELARHYGFKIDPAPVRSPEKKGKVESAVKYVCGNFLRAGAFHTVVEANTDLPDWLLSTAGMRIHGTTGRRPLEAFAAEKLVLLPLPATPFEPVEWKSATVHRDSHIEFDRRLYSVPWTHIGQAVWVKATQASVMIYLNDQRIATHDRRGGDHRSTAPAHLPPHRAELAERSIAYWTERADAMDPDVGSYIRHVVDSDTVLSKLRDVQAIVTHLDQFPVQRAAAACRRADYFANYSYQGVRRILASALDLDPLPNSHPKHGQLTEPRFARPVAELLPPTEGDNPCPL
jgi:transposase